MFWKIFLLLFICISVKANSVKLKKLCPNGTQVDNDPNLARLVDYPFMVSLRVPESKFLLCAGMILSETWILTAAHCLNSNGSILVQAGNFYDHFICPEQHAITQEVPPENYLIHNGKVQAPYPSDIALIKLNTPLNFNSYIHPALLPRRNHPMYDQEVIVVGWALTGPQAPYLQQMELMTFDRFGCIGETVPPTIWPGEMPFSRSGPNIRQVCVKAKNATSDSTCYDNSGGPLLLKVTGELIGVLNFGNECPDDVMERKSYYAKVADFLDWIEMSTGLTRKKQLRDRFGEKMLEEVLRMVGKLLTKAKGNKQIK